MPRADVLVGVGIIVLFVAFAIPTLADSPDSLEVESLDMSEGDSVPVGTAFVITADVINPGSVGYTLASQETGAQVNATISEGVTEVVVLDSNNVSVTPVDIQGGNSVLTVVEYPATMGWSDSAQVVSQNIDVIVVMLAFILVVGMTIWVWA